MVLLNCISLWVDAQLHPTGQELFQIVSRLVLTAWGEEGRRGGEGSNTMGRQGFKTIPEVFECLLTSLSRGSQPWTLRYRVNAIT